MADYKAIKGFNIQTFSSDPPNLQLGEMWYNSTTGKYIFFTDTRSNEKLQNATIQVKNILKTLLVI